MDHRITMDFSFIAGQVVAAGEFDQFIGEELVLRAILMRFGLAISSIGPVDLAVAILNQERVGTVVMHNKFLVAGTSQVVMQIQVVVGYQYEAVRQDCSAGLLVAVKQISQSLCLIFTFKLLSLVLLLDQ